STDYIIKTKYHGWAMVALDFNPSKQETEAGRSLKVQGLQNKCQERLQSYTEKLCLKKQNKKQANKERQKITI
ncbi:hypothetical protein ACQP3F_35030, partial [Escherichia coli]